MPTITWNTWFAHILQKNYRIIQRISKLPPVQVYETSCMYLQYIDNNFNILEVICLLWMCTPNVCQPFFLIRLSGLSSQCVQLKEKQLIGHSKTDSLQTIPYFPRLSEHAWRLNPDVRRTTLLRSCFITTNCQEQVKPCYLQVFLWPNDNLFSAHHGNLCITQELI